MNTWVTKEERKKWVEGWTKFISWELAIVTSTAIIVIIINMNNNSDIDSNINKNNDENFVF